jgi:hypothetical protein
MKQGNTAAEIIKEREAIIRMAIRLVNESTDGETPRYRGAGVASASVDFDTLHLLSQRVRRLQELLLSPSAQSLPGGRPQGRRGARTIRI